MPKSKELKFEDQLARLEELVGQMEHPDTTLDYSLKLFEEGVGLIRACQTQLDDSKRKIEVLLKSSNEIRDITDDEEKED